MSTSYHPYCVDCDERHHLDDCRDTDMLQKLCRNADKLAVMNDLVQEIGHGRWGQPMTIYLDDSHRDRIELAWFARHYGHRIRVQTEYGTLLDDCGKVYRCEACGHAKTCGRKEDHDGEHAEKRFPGE